MMDSSAAHPLTRPDSRMQTLLPMPVAYLVGVIWAIGAVTLAGLPDVGLTFGVIGIALLFVVYPICSVVWGTSAERGVEWAFSALGVLTIVLALAVDPRWLAFGWLVHGVWDALHHRDHHVVGLRGIPHWYVMACLVCDIPAAIGLYLVL